MDITPETSSSESSESDSTSSSEDSDDESDDVQPSSRRRRPPRQSSLKVHSRRVTDPISRKPMGRPRSHTTGFPLGSIQSPSRAGTPLRSSTLAVQHRVDPLVVLERAIEELEKATKAIDEEASRVQAMQEKVDAGIAEVVAAVDEAQKAIDDTGFQQVSFLPFLLCLRRPTDSRYNRTAPHARGPLLPPSHLAHSAIFVHRRPLGSPRRRSHCRLLALVALCHLLPDHQVHRHPPPHRREVAVLLEVGGLGGIEGEWMSRYRVVVFI